MSDLASRIAKLTPEQKALLDKKMREGRTPGAREPVAIVGMGCRFPGGISNLKDFWTLLITGTDAIGEVPPDRWSLDSLHDSDPDAPGKVASRFGGFVRDVDRFDAPFFAISPREASRMDPQQRLLLEVAWNALEDAGYTRDGVAGSGMGVFVGAHSQSSDYLQLQYEDPDTIDAFTGTGTAHNLFAGRLSYAFDLHGPAVVVDTACSSSLVAAHLAIQSLRLGESDAALVAGVNLVLTPHFSIAASRMHMLAPDGRCKAFDHRADGFVRSEGCGAVVLKRLTDAQADGDRIIAVIRGSATNQDGRTNGITAPNGRAQRAVVERALKDASVSPLDVGYVETHGTGTVLGDPIEVEGLAATVGRPRPDGAPVYIGAVKSNIGHLEGAAGIAGLIKAALVVERGVAPPIVHLEKLNPHMDVAGTRLLFPTQATSWGEPGRPRRAGVSSFGWSGTNAHLVLEQAPAAPPVDIGPEDDAFVLPISAKSAPSLGAIAEAYRDELAASSNPRDLCFTAATRRHHHEYRAASVGRTAPALRDALQPEAGSKARERPPKTVFVFPGQGSQWLGMGRSLLRTEAAFRESMEAFDAAVRAESRFSILEELTAAPEVSRLAQIDVVQPVLVGVEIALAALWRSWGIEPLAVVGHSLGEVAAANVAGILDVTDAAKVIARRSRLLRGIAGRGGMAVVELGEAEARKAISRHEANLGVAVVNGPRSTVLSGSTEALQEVLSELEAGGVFCRSIKVDVASHSPQVDELLPPLRAALDDVRPANGGIPLYSTVSGRVVEGAQMGATYWCNNLRRPVRFHDAVSALLESGHDAFLEMSPHPILVPGIEDAISDSAIDAAAFASLKRDEDEKLVLAQTLAGLYTRGATVDWTAYYRHRGRVVDLPAYPWRGDAFWLDRPRGAWLPGPRSAAKPSTDVASWLYEPRWRPEPARRKQPPAPARWLVLADASGVGEALSRALTAAGQDVICECRKDAPLDPLLAERLPSGAVQRIVHLWNLDVPEGSTPETVEAAQPLGCGSVVRLAQAIDRKDLESPPRVHVITRGAQADRTTGATVSQTLVWGLGRVWAEEHPESWGGLIDLDPSATAERSASSLCEELLSGEEDDGVAFVDDKRLVLRLARFEGRAGVFGCKADAAYFVSGGLGGVGLETAAFLVSRGARRLVLAGRTALPERSLWDSVEAQPFERQIRGIRGLESAGAAVEAVSLDVGDSAAVEALVSSRRAAGSSSDSRHRPRGGGDRGRPHRQTRSRRHARGPPAQAPRRVEPPRPRRSSMPGLHGLLLLPR